MKIDWWAMEEALKFAATVTVFSGLAAMGTAVLYLLLGPWALLIPGGFSISFASAYYWITHNN